MEKYSLSLKVKGSNSFQGGKYENNIVSTSRNPRRQGESIQVRVGVLDKVFIPLRYLHPVPVPIKGCRAIATSGDLCGEAVMIKWVARSGDMATVALGDRIMDIQVDTLCKFS